MVHPLLIASYMSVILALYLPEAYGLYPSDIVWRLVLTIVLLTAVFPSLTVLGLWLFTPWVSDLELTNREERVLPFIVLIAYYGLAIWLLVFRIELGEMVQVLLLGTTLMIGIMVVINTRFKISIHTAAIWGLAGAALGLAVRFPGTQMPTVAIGAVLAGGLIGTSRLYLGYHRPAEVWVGTLFGFFYNLAVVMIFL